MRRALPLLVALLAAHAAAAPQQDGVLAVRLEWEPGLPGGSHVTDVPLSAEAPKGVEPPAGLRDGRWGRIPLGDGPGLLVVVDEHPEQPRIWIDRNFDESFADDPHAEWKDAGALKMRQETVLVPFAGERLPVPVGIQLVRPSGETVEMLKLQVFIHRRGTVVLGGLLRDVALRDDRNELRFDRGDGIVLFVDADGDGSFATAHGTHEHLHADDVLRVGESAWTWRATGAEGAVVELHPVKDAGAMPPRRWPSQSTPSSGMSPVAPSESFDELSARFGEERGRPYAERQATVELLGRLGTEEAGAFVLGIAREDPLPTIRAAALRALAYKPYAALWKSIVPLASDDDASVAAAAMQALHGIGYEGRADVFRSLLASKDPVVAGNAARHLAYTGAEDAAAAGAKLFRDLKSDPGRYQVYTGLRTLREGPPLDIVLEAASSTYASLCAQALRDLHAIGDPSAAATSRAAAERRPVNLVTARAVVDVLAADGTAASMRSLLAMAEAGPDTLRPDLVRALARLRGGEAVDVLLKTLASPDASLRALAARILAAIPVSPVADTLAKRLGREKDEEVALALVEALGDLADPATAPVLLKHSRRKGAVRLAALRGLARIGFVDREIRRLFTKLLTSKDDEDRILAIDAVAAAGEADLGPRVLDSLGHRTWQVRLACVEALRRLRAREWVKPFIDHLADEEVRRVRAAIAQALFEMTGSNLYDETALWERWWADNGETFELPDPVPTLPPREAGGSVGVFYGLPVDSERVIFVLDQSGSMSAVDVSTAAGREDRRNRLEVAVMETLAAVHNLGTRARVNVILFQSTVSAWKKSLAPLDPKNRVALRKHLESQKPTGGTNLYDGLEAALDDRDVDTILLLSDGVPGAGKYVATDDILRAVRRLNQTRRIAIHCVSLGRDSDLLRRLAEENGGRYVRK